MDTRVKVFALKFIRHFIVKPPLLDFIYIWHDGRYRDEVLLSAITTVGHDLVIKVRDLEFSDKIQNFCNKVYIAILSRLYNEFHVYLA